MLKKLILSTLLVYSFFSLAKPMNIDVSGSVRVRTNTTDFTEDFDADTQVSQIISNISTLATLNLSVSKMIDFSLYIESTTNSDIALSLPVKISRNLTLKAGRSTYQIADGKVIGTYEYQNVPNLFNLISLMGKTAHFNYEFVGISQPPSNTEYLSTSDADTPSFLNSLGILSVDVKNLPSALNSLNLHTIALLDSEESLLALRLGTTAGFSQMGVNGSVTVAHSNVMGDEELKSGLLLDLTLETKRRIGKKMINFQAGVHFNGANYDSLFYDAFNQSGMLNLQTWDSENSYASLGANYQVKRGTKVGAMAYYFQLDSAAELDVFYKKEISEGVELTVWAGLLSDLETIVSSKVEASILAQF